MGRKPASKAKRIIPNNPIGVIGSFIVLIETIAGLVLKFADHLDKDERAPLIWFLVIFPILMLAAFVYLVAFHYQKLYAPSDFRNEDRFFGPQTPAEVAERVSKKTDISDSELKDTLTPEVIVKHMKQGVHYRTTDAMPGWSLQTNNHIPADLKEQLRDDFKTNYVLAEELVFKKLESEMAVKIDRSQRVASLELDGVIEDAQRVKIIDVKLLMSPKTRIDRHRLYNLGDQIQSLIDKLGIGKPVTVILVVVTTLQSNARQELEANLHKIKSGAPFDLEVRVFDFNELKSEFGIV